MKIKIDNIAVVNQQLVSDLQPWVNFFDTKQAEHLSPLSDLHLNSLQAGKVADSPCVMKRAVPNNPFSEANSSSLLNKSVLKGHGDGTVNDSSNTIMLNKSRFADFDTAIADDSEGTEGALRRFSLSEIPAIFHQEQALIDLYYFIAEQKTVTVEKICQQFPEISTEKLKIFANLLTRKNFVRQTQNTLTIEN